MKRFVIYFLLIMCCLLTLVILVRFVPPHWIPGHNNNRVLLISMDGFRHDYIEKVKASGGKTPNFDYLMSEGARIMRMKNAFPTFTLPNHQTLITGLYPENHGVVHNTFVDKNLNDDRFDMNNQDNLNDGKWFEKWPEPIWVTLQKQGRLTASHLWPLTDAPIDGQLPFFQESQYTLLNKVSSYFPFLKRVEDVVLWFTDTRAHIDFSMLYFPEPDETGHEYGPNDQNVFDTVMQLDNVTGHLIDLLKAKGLWNKVNIIITADHGMSEDSESREIRLDDYVDPSWYTYTALTPIATLYPIKGKEKALYDSLKNRNPHLEVYWRHEVPKSLNFNLDNGRIAPLILIAENKWMISQNKSNKTGIYGSHGYNNSNTDVQPFFIAQGPNIMKNYTMPFGNSVDIYPLMCFLLGVQPKPNNGSLDNIKEIINPAFESQFGRIIIFLRHNSWITVGCSVMLLSCLLVLVMLMSGWCRRKKKASDFSNYGYSKLDS